MDKYFRIPMVRPLERRRLLEESDLFEVSRDADPVALKRVLDPFLALLEKHGLGKRRTEQIHDISVDYMEIKFDDVFELVKHQIEQFRKHRLEPGSIFMGHEDFRNLVNQTVAQYGTRFRNPLVTPTVPLRFQVGFEISPDIRYLTRNLLDFEDSLKREIDDRFYGAKQIERTDLYDGRLRFTGYFLYDLPIHVLPWIQGVLVTPQTKR